MSSSPEADRVAPGPPDPHKVPPLSRRLLPRADSLFVRLLGLQIVLVTSVVLVFGVLFYMERSRAIARLQAHFWGPAIEDVLSRPIDRPLPPGSPVLRQQIVEPTDTLPLPLRTPRSIAMNEALAEQGLVVEASALVRSRGRFRVWLRVREDAPGAAARWMELSGDLVESVWPLRLAAAVGVAGLLLAAASWYFTRRLTRPLQRLREHIDVVHPRRLMADAPSPPPQDPAAPPEVAAIAAAHHRLLVRLTEHERERALLLAGVSHDLRSPLGRIRLAAQLLPEDAGVARRRDVILRNVDAADRLIGSFLDHVRAGELPLDETVDVGAVARKVQTDAASAGHAVALTLPPEDAPAPRLTQCNGVLVERTIANLVDNALRHGHPPVRLAVAVDRAAGCLRVDVEDAGPGIPPEQRELALSAFGRGDASRSTPGTGLGLSIVQRVCARLGGRLDIQTEPGMNRMRLVFPWSG